MNQFNQILLKNKMRLLTDKIITHLKQIKCIMLCIINCQNIVIKIHTTKIIEGKTNKILHKTLEGILTAKILNIQINNSIRSDIKV